MYLVKQLALLFLMLAAFFAGLAGFLLNWVVYITVFQFGNIIGNNPGMLAAWGVLRDVGNICLLFGFIFMGISTILNLPGNEFTARRALPALIIFAVLMNFSLFAAEAVIDASNALGTTLYKQASQGTCSGGLQGFKDCATNVGISGSIMKVSGISGIFNLDGTKNDQVVEGQDFGAIIEILGLAIFAAVTAFVFFAAVFMFITRTVVLAFLMAVSPIGFAGMAVPPLHEYASMWWKQLLQQSFFAPIFILFILISIKFMEGIAISLNAVSGGGGVASLASAFKQSGTSNVSMIVNFVLITGFMLGALIMAKSLGAAGADRATKFAGAATFGATGFVARRTVGRASSFGATTLLKSKFGQTNTVGKFLVNRFEAGGKASYDVRGSKTVAGLAKSQHIELGDAQRGGYSGIVHAEEEKRKEYAKKVKKTKSDLADEAAHKKTKEVLQGELANAEADLAAQTAANEAALKPQREALARKRADVEAARASGDRARIDAIEREYNNDLRGYDVAKEAAEKKLDPAKSRIATAKTGIANADKAIKEVNQAPQRRYANSLHNNPKNPLDWWSYAGGVGQDADHHAAEKILNDLNKNDNEKVVDAISALSGKLGSGGGSGGAPAAGGGHP